MDFFIPAGDVATVVQHGQWDQDDDEGDGDGGDSRDRGDDDGQDWDDDSRDDSDTKSVDPILAPSPAPRFQLTIHKPDPLETPADDMAATTSTKAHGLWLQPVMPGAGADLGALMKQRVPPSDDFSSDSDGTSTTGGFEEADQRMNVATHIVLRVAWLCFENMDELRAPVLHPGRLGLSHHFAWESKDFAMATASVVRLRDRLPLEAPQRRCAIPPAELRDLSLESARGSGRVRRIGEAKWPPEAPGQACIRIARAEVVVHVGLVVGTEVVGVTRPLDIRNIQRRWYSEYDVFHPDSFQRLQRGEGLPPIGCVKVALDLWPFGFRLYVERGPLVQLPGERPAEDEEEEEEEPPSCRCDLTDELDLLCSDYLSPDGPDLLAQCAMCRGAGQRPCVHCNGNGMLVCVACGGRPVPACARCGGAGRTFETFEAWSGHTGPHPTLCVAGGQQCTFCWGGVAVCASCFGAGDLPCRSCGGSGSTPCACTTSRS